jgi:8-oxo-dGTP diphosphatase
MRVTAAIIVRDNKVLIARRKTDDENGGLWEFPGGTVHEGESPASCLRREIREELGIDIIIRRPFIIVDHDTPATGIKLITYLAESEPQEIKHSDHDEMRWVDIPELTAFNFTPADRAVVTALLKQAHL